MKTATRSLSLKRRLGRYLCTTICAAACVGLLTVPSEARADHPVAVAVIGAAGAVTAATIGGGAVVVAAVITTYGGKAESEDRDEVAVAPGTDENGNIIEEGGGSRNRVMNRGASISGKVAGKAKRSTLGEASLDPSVRSFLDRSVDMKLQRFGDRGLGATTSYKFEGDIMKSDNKTKKFVSKDGVQWDFDLEGPGALPFSVDDLTLSTTEVAKTHGYSSVVITAKQGNRTIMTWRARAEQGRQSKYDKTPKGTKVKASRGRVHFEDMLFMIPVKYNKRNTAKVVVTMQYEGSGQRTK